MDELFMGLRVLVSLGVVLGVIWYAHRRITRGRGAAKKINAIDVISRQGVAQKASVVILDAEGQRFVLGVTEHAITVLHQAPAPDLATSRAAVRQQESASAVASAPASAPIERTVPPATSFDGVMAAVSRTTSTTARHAAPAAPSMPALQRLHSGSILSAETWKRSLAAIRQGPS